MTKFVTQSWRTTNGLFKIIMYYNVLNKLPLCEVHYTKVVD